MNTCKNSFLFSGTVPYRSLPFRSIPFHFTVSEPNTFRNGMERFYSFSCEHLQKLFCFLEQFHIVPSRFVPFRSILRFQSRTLFGTECNVSTRSRVNTCKNSFLFSGTVPYRSLPFRSIPFHFTTHFSEPNTFRNGMERFYSFSCEHLQKLFCFLEQFHIVPSRFVPFRSILRLTFQSRTLFGTEWNVSTRSRVNTCKNSFLFSGTVPYRSLPFRSIPFRSRANGALITDRTSRDGYEKKTDSLIDALKSS